MGELLWETFTYLTLSLWGACSAVTAGISYITDQEDQSMLVLRFWL